MNNNEEKQLMRLINESNLKREMEIIIDNTKIITGILMNLRDNGSIYFEDIEESINKLSNIRAYCEGVIENDELSKAEIVF